MTRHANLAGAIYGTVIVTALIAGLTENDSLSEPDIIATVAATMAAFWVAHAYATLIAHGTMGGKLPGPREARAALAHEWPVAQSALPALLVLLLGELGLYSPLTSERGAIVVGLVALAGWGWLVARRDEMDVWRAAVVALGSLALGLIVISVKLAIH